MGCFTGVGSCLPFCKREVSPDAAKVAKKTAKKWRKSKGKKKELDARSLPYDISDECLLLAVVVFYWDVWYPVRVNINGLDLNEFKEGQGGVAFQVNLDVTPKTSPEPVPATPRPASRINITKVRSCKTGFDTEAADIRRRDALTSRSENLKKAYEERSEYVMVCIYNYRDACLRNKEEADQAFREKALKQIESKQLIHSEAMNKLADRNAVSRPRKRLMSAITRAKNISEVESSSPSPTPTTTGDETERADKEERSSLDAFYDQ